MYHFWRILSLNFISPWKRWSHLCHCADKEKGRELEEGEVEDPAMDNTLEYASDNKYQTPPMGVPRELCLIKDVPDCVIPSNSCGCSQEKAIKISDDEVETIVENEVLIPIWVEHSPTQDRVVCGQHAVCGRPGVHCSIPSIHHYHHRVDVQLNSGYELAK